MHAFSQNVLVALLIGAEVFAIASLWPLSDWAVKSRNRWVLVAALLVIVACLAPNAGGVVRHGTPLWLAARVLDWAILALLVVFPNAVCIVSAQSLARAGMRARWARAAALFVSGIAVLVAPFATIVAGCGLAGACY
jgi:hypothetical protein